MDRQTSAKREGLGRLSVKFFRYRNLVLKHWWIILLTASAGLAYQGWKVSQKQRVFESKAQLMVREDIVLGQGKMIGNAGQSEFLGTNMTMVRSPEVTQRAEKAVSIKYPNVASAPVNLDVGLVRGTMYIDVTGTGAMAEYTQHYVDAVIDAFLEVRRETVDVSVKDVRTDFNKVATSRLRELKEAQAELDKYVKENNMQFWKQLSEQSATFLSGLKTRQAVLQTEMQRYKSLTPDQLLAIPPAPAAPTGAAADASGTDAGSGSISANLYTIYLQKNQELSLAQNRLDERSKIWKPKHPKLIALQEDVATIKRAIEVIKEQNREATAQRIDAIKAELASLEESIKDWNVKVQEASSKDGEFQGIKGKVERLQKQYDEAEKARLDLSDAPVYEPFRRSSNATPPVLVDKGVVKHLLMGLVGGLALGFLILVILDRADDRMTSSSEILDQFSEPILAQIPSVHEKGVTNAPLIMPDDERYSYAEAFRSFRSSLIFMPDQTELRTILITSAIPNEGKSTISSNLAITMAAAGASVALVDADLRRGDLASLFDIDGRTGLSNVLRGEVKWQSAIQKTKFPTLSIIPRGPVTNQSSELLLLPTVNTLLDELREHYDLIIFNTAPILATDDTPSLSPNFDGTVMVMRAQFTSARLTQNALNALYQRQVNVLGLVLNCVNTEMPDYYYYKYPKYYATQ